jgi:formylglycine-generating enzyme required for sulfatase activity
LFVFLVQWLNPSLLERKVNKEFQTGNLPKEVYAGYKAAGDSLFDRRQYAEAKMKYEQALAYNSNDQNVTRQIEECKRLIAIVQGAERQGMVYIPGGAFSMGSDDGEDDEKPMHQVYVNEFCIDKYEVTVEQYGQFLVAQGHRQPEKWDEQVQFPQRPVVYVNWEDANAYALWTGKRLPTEAEWEYAGRGGTTGVWGKPKYEYVWGNDVSSIPANFNADGSRTREWKSAQRYLREGGTYAPNGYGLYDMAGNVWEWCADWYAENYYQDSLERNPTGPGIGTQRVLRGGAWSSALADLRCANRLRYFPSNADDIVGFRCAKDIR